MTKKKEARQIRIQKILLERTKVKISDLAKELMLLQKLYEMI